MREAHAGVAAGRLDDGPARLDEPVALGGLHHRQRDAVLHRAAGVEVLHLDQHLRRQPGGHAAEPDERRVADEVDEGVADLHGTGLPTGRGGGVLRARAAYGGRRYVGPCRSRVAEDEHRSSRTGEGRDRGAARRRRLAHPARALRPGQRLPAAGRRRLPRRWSTPGTKRAPKALLAALALARHGARRRHPPAAEPRPQRPRRRPGRGAVAATGAGCSRTSGRRSTCARAGCPRSTRSTRGGRLLARAPARATGFAPVAVDADVRGRRRPAGRRRAAGRAHARPHAGPLLVPAPLAPGCCSPVTRSSTCAACGGRSRPRLHRRPACRAPPPHGSATSTSTSPASPTAAHVSTGARAARCAPSSPDGPHEGARPSRGPAGGRATSPSRRRTAAAASAPRSASASRCSSPRPSWPARRSASRRRRPRAPPGRTAGAGAGSKPVHLVVLGDSAAAGLGCDAGRPDARRAARRRHRPRPAPPGRPRGRGPHRRPLGRPRGAGRAGAAPAGRRRGHHHRRQRRHAPGARSPPPTRDLRRAVQPLRDAGRAGRGRHRAPTSGRSSR